MDSGVTAAAFLAVVAMSDGLRLLPAGAIVVSRLALGDWLVTLPSAGRHAGGLRLVSWCSPVLLPLVLSAPNDEATPLRRRVTRFRARLRRTRAYVAALRAIGVLNVAALIVALPWLTARSGAWGLLVGVSLVAWLCAVQAVVAVAAFRRLGAAIGRGVLTSVRYLWPFSAPRAAEDVMQRVVAGIPRLVLLHELLPPEAFDRFARPLFFDAARGNDAQEIAELQEYLGETRVHRIVNCPPSDPEGDAYCPRCGATFYHGARFCSDCAAVELRAVSSF